MLAIEMSDARGVDYHAIHAAGCRDLRDGQPIPGAPTTVAAVADSVCEATGYCEDEYDEDSVTLKPCARQAMRKAAAAAPAVVEPVANVEPDESTDVELPDVEPVTLGDRLRALGGANPDHLAALADEADALQRRAEIAETSVRTALAGKFDAMTRAAYDKSRAESLEATNRSLNETIRHMVDRFETNEAKMRALRVAVAAALD